MLNEEKTIKENNKIFLNEDISIDVTLDELKHLIKVKYLEYFFQILNSIWIGKNFEREFDTRIGSIDISKSDEGNIEMKFVTRFIISEEIFKIFKELMKIKEN